MNIKDLEVYKPNFLTDQPQGVLISLAVLVVITIVCIVIAWFLHRLAVSYAGLDDLSDKVFKWFLHISTGLFLIIGVYSAYSGFTMEFSDIGATTTKIVQENIDFSAKESEIVIYTKKGSNRPAAFSYLDDYYAFSDGKIVQINE